MRHSFSTSGKPMFKTKTIWVPRAAGGTGYWHRKTGKTHMRWWFCVKRQMGVYPCLQGVRSEMQFSPSAQGCTLMETSIPYFTSYNSWHVQFPNWESPISYLQPHSSIDPCYQFCRVKTSAVVLLNTWCHQPTFSHTATHNQACTELSRRNTFHMQLWQAVSRHLTDQQRVLESDEIQNPNWLNPTISGKRNFQLREY